MTKQEIIDKRSKLLLEAHAIMAGANVTEEQRTAVDRMLADANTMKADIERLFSLEVIDEENRSKPGAVPRDNPGAAMTETRSKDERREATKIALRNYLLNKPFETRDLTVAVDGVLIPAGVADAVIAKKSWGSVYDVVNHLRTATGEPMAVPLVNDTANLFVLNSASITTTDPTIAGGTIAIDDIRSNPILLDNSLVTDSVFDLVGFVEQAIQDRYARTLAKWITLGNTSNVAALTTIAATITGNTTLVTKYGDLLSMLAALDPAYYPNATFVMSNTTLASQVLNVVDGNGRPIFLPFNDGGISGFSGTIFGFPVKLNPFSVSNGVNAQYLWFGDFQAGYTLREVTPTPVIKKTSERYIELNKVGFIGFGRVGGGVTDAGTHPIISLQGK